MRIRILKKLDKEVGRYIRDLFIEIIEGKKVIL
jgi:hypothetical protein